MAVFSGTVATSELRDNSKLGLPELPPLLAMLEFDGDGDLPYSWNLVKTNKDREKKTC